MAETEDGLLLLSPSQIATWEDCERKWGWRHLDGIPAPQNASAALGSEVHDQQLAPYLLEGRAPDFSRPSGYIAASGLHWLPKPKTPGMEVEKHFILRLPNEPFAIQGYKDFTVDDSIKIPGLPGGVPGVGDHKTTSNLKWMKTKEDLSTDVQAIVYASDALVATGTQAVDLAWVYYQTRGAHRSDRVHVRLTREHTFSELGRIVVTARHISATRKSKPRALDLVPNTDACEKYGGCPYRDRCTDLNPLALVQAGFRNERNKELVMNETEDLLKRLSEQNGMTPPPSAEIPTPSMPSWATAAVDPREVKINPPEYQPPPPVIPVEVPVQAQAPNPGAGNAEPVKKRGRPKKAADATTATVSMLPVETSEHTTIAVPQETVTAAKEVVQGFRLYVDCFPVNEEYLSLEMVVLEAKKKIQAEMGLPDYRFADFGRGPGILSIAVRELVLSGAKGGSLVVDTRTPEGSACVSDLVACAESVCRGMR